MGVCFLKLEVCCLKIGVFSKNTGVILEIKSLLNGNFFRNHEFYENGNLVFLK